MSDKTDIKSMTLSELEVFMTEVMGEKKFRAKQIYEWMHVRLDENGSKKKLSKRDMGANLDDYERMGYAPECVAEYVMTLLNSNFEEWHAQNADRSYL